MSFQAYLDNIKAKTGKTPEDFKQLADKKGLLKPGTKAGEIIAWLKKDFDLGHGHAMAVYSVFKGLKEQKKDDIFEKHFTGEKEKGRPVYDSLLKKIQSFGADIKPDPVVSYISTLRGDKKFAVIQITKDKLTIGLKIKNLQPTNRFEASGNWNTMMTHKVSIISSKEINKELFDWLQKAYLQSDKKG